MNTYPPVPPQYATWAHVFNTLYLICACTGSGAALSKAVAWQRERSPELLALVFIRLFAVVAFISAMPWTYHHLARATGIPNIGTLVTYPCIVLCSLASLLILRLWQQVPAGAWKSSRWLLGVYAVLLPSMIILFFWAPATEDRPIDFDVHYATNPQLAAFQLIYNSCYAAGLIANIRMLLRYRALVRGMPWTRLGLGITFCGAAFGLGMVLVKVPSLIALNLGSTSLNFANVVIGPLLSSVAALLYHLGATVPAWGSRLHQKWRLLVSFLQMQALWYAIAQARPGIAYAPVPRSRTVAVWKAYSLKRWLYRAVIEIRDGQRELRPFFDPQVEHAAYRLAAEAGVPDSSLQAVVDAAVLAAALRGSRDGTPVEGADSVNMSTTSGDLAEEIASLAAVGRAFSDSPVVADIIASAAQTPVNNPV